MRSVREFNGVYFHREPVDMRNQLNGLSVIVETARMGDLMGKNLFVFANRRRDLMKVLYFDKSGFALWMKKLEKEKFPWPKKHESEVVRLTPEQFEWLLDGYDVWKLKPFAELEYSRVS
jgi:transposase